MTGELKIPARFWRVRYNGACHPGKPGLDGFADGANCQNFAYELLCHFDREVPNFRSSELWADTRHSKIATRLRPLDLLLFNGTPQARGAHVAVYLGGGNAIHLCKAKGRPVIWSLKEFSQWDSYRVLIGAKRFAIGGKRPVDGQAHRIEDN
jgi:murein DD-endopeptidase / murein LD-carboxypeptidase